MQPLIAAAKRFLLGAAVLAAPGPSAAPPLDPVERATSADGLYVVFQTTLGTIACSLAYDKAPVTVGNFVGLVEGTKEFVDPRTGAWVKRPFYDGLKFHRILPGFVVQGGDPLGNGSGGPGYAFIDEFDSSLRHDAPGVLSMANSGPNTNGSQFFLTLAAAPHLDDKHTVFGRLVLGQDVLERMSRVKRIGAAEKSTPVGDIVMSKVYVVRTGSAARAFDPARAFARQEEVRVAQEAEKKRCEQEFHARLEADERRAKRSASGLMSLVQSPGQGEPPRRGDTISAHFTGYLENGTRFFSTLDRGEPLRIPIGIGQVIPGWDEAFLDMRPGEKRRLIIPAALGYGARGNQRAGIPPQATLVFDVQLLGVERK